MPLVNSAAKCFISCTAKRIAEATAPKEAQAAAQQAVKALILAGFRIGNAGPVLIDGSQRILLDVNVFPRRVVAKVGNAAEALEIVAEKPS